MHVGLNHASVNADDVIEQRAGTAHVACGLKVYGGAAAHAQDAVVRVGVRGEVFCLRSPRKKSEMLARPGQLLQLRRGVYLHGLKSAESPVMWWRYIRGHGTREQQRAISSRIDCNAARLEQTRKVEQSGALMRLSRGWKSSCQRASVSVHTRGRDESRGTSISAIMDTQRLWLPSEACAYDSQSRAIQTQQQTPSP
jgi:hypothetical protein